MRLPICAAVALTAALGATGSGIDVTAAAPKPKNAPVSITFADASTDKILSDSNTNPYQDGVGRVVAYIQASANSALIFSTNASNLPGRTLRFFFDDCFSPPCQNPSEWPSPLNERSGISANALDPGGSGAVLAGGMLAMDVGEELRAFVKIDIPLDSDPAFWNVCFDSRDLIAPCSPAGVDSTDGRIRRDAANQWRIFATESDRADLNRDNGSRRGTRYEHKGTFSMPFSLTVTCVNASDCPIP